eukprot:1100612-Prymnesium_polylepis.1
MKSPRRRSSTRKVVHGAFQSSSRNTSDDSASAFASFGLSSSRPPVGRTAPTLRHRTDGGFAPGSWASAARFRTEHTAQLYSPLTPSPVDLSLTIGHWTSSS